MISDKLRRNLPYILPILSIILTTILLTIILFYQFEFNQSSEHSDSLIKTFLGITFIILILREMSIILERYSYPVQLSIAVVGFPQSGKTTMIVSLWGEIFARRIIVQAIPRGTKTIERINDCLEKLQKGRSIGPTRDQDRFGFKGDITYGKYPFTRTYKVEFGDFPGDNSEEYMTKYGPWLHNTEFFKWVMSSDAIIFVIDIGRYLAPDENRLKYVAQISGALRAAWQHYLDSNDDRKDEVRKHPLILVFTKADLFGVNKYSENGLKFEEVIAKLGFGEETPPIKEIDHKSLDQGEARVRQDFAELIQYFQSECHNFSVLFISSFGLYNGKRLGLSELLFTILPIKKK